MVYVAMFAISTALLYFASKEERGVEKWIAVALALLLPCLIAGVRDDTVGTDIYSYPTWQFESALKRGLPAFMMAEAGTSAFGWNLMTWLSCHYIQNFNFYLFVIEAFCILPVFAFFEREFPRQAWAGMLAWFLLFYPFTLNGMRQSVAMGIVLYSCIYARRGSPVKFVVTVAIATLFHQTALVGFFLYPVLRLFGYGVEKSSYDTISIRYLAFAVIAAGLVCVFTFGDALVVGFSFLKASYAFQVLHLGAMDLNWSSFCLLAVVVLAYMLARTNVSYKSSGGNACALSTDASEVSARLNLLTGVLACAVFGCVVCQFDFISNTLGRLGMYFNVPICVLAPLMLRDKETPRWMAFFLFAAFAAYFVLSVVVLGQNEVYPYTSSIAPFLSW